MKERFEGQNEQHLIDALKRQEFADGNLDIATALKQSGELVEFAKNDLIVKQEAEDNDLFFLLSGTVAIVVKSNQVATRRAGQLVGEMAAVDPSLKRSADVRALDTVVALKINSATFGEIGRKYPQIWQPMARELSRRLNERNSLIPPPNDAPKLFIISSKEALEVAREVQSALSRDALGTVWTDGVFFAGGYPLESLEKAVDTSDFAVAIAQADDIVGSRGATNPTLRDNVVFELGLFMGKLSRYRTILLHPGTTGLKLPSDLHGLNMVPYAPGKPADLTARIATACNDIRKIIQNLGVRKFIA
jgi:CRP/FNR family cyclic AMP-dependent transcriptional regulator